MNPDKEEALPDEVSVRLRTPMALLKPRKTPV